MKLRIIGTAIIIFGLVFGAVCGSKYLKEFASKASGEETMMLEEEAKEEAARQRENYLESVEQQPESIESASEEDSKKIRVATNDVVAKLTINACKIDALVYQNEEADFYLHKDANGNESKHGEIYTNQYDCKVPIIYGHHMSDGTMFASLDCAYVGAEVVLEDIGYLEDETRTYKITSMKPDVPASEVWDYLSDVEEGLVLITCSYGVEDGRLVIIAN